MTNDVDSHNSPIIDDYDTVWDRDIVYDGVLGRVDVQRWATYDRFNWGRIRNGKLIEFGDTNKPLGFPNSYQPSIGDVCQYYSGSGWTLKGNSTDGTFTDADESNEIERLKYEYYKAVIQNFKGFEGTHGGSFDARPGAVNLLGIRGWREGRHVADVRNEWDDTIIAIWIEPTTLRSRCREFEATTQPGIHDKNAIGQYRALGIDTEYYGKKGNGMMIPGQYLYRRAKHGEKGGHGLAQAGFAFDKDSFYREDIIISQQGVPENDLAKGTAYFKDGKLKEIKMIANTDSPSVAGKNYDSEQGATILFLQGADSLGSGATINIENITNGEILIGDYDDDSDGVKIENAGSNYHFCCHSKPSSERTTKDRCRFSLAVPGVPESVNPFHPDGSFCARLGTIDGENEIMQNRTTGLYSIENKSSGEDAEFNVTSSNTVTINPGGSGYKEGEIFLFGENNNSIRFKITAIGSGGSIVSADIIEYIGSYTGQIIVNDIDAEPNIEGRVRIEIENNELKFRDLIVDKKNLSVNWSVCDTIDFKIVGEQEDHCIPVLLVGNRGCGKAKFARVPHSTTSNSNWWKNSIYDTAADYPTEYAAIFANIHVGMQKTVENWSQGCQVIHIPNDRGAYNYQDDLYHTRQETDKSFYQFLEIFDNHPGLTNRWSGDENGNVFQRFRYGRHDAGCGDTVYYTLVTGAMVSKLVGNDNFPYLRKGTTKVPHNGVQGEKFFLHMISEIDKFTRDEYKQEADTNFRGYGENNVVNQRYSKTHKYIDSHHLLLKGLFSFISTSRSSCLLDEYYNDKSNYPHANVKQIIEKTLMTSYFFSKDVTCKRVKIQLSPNMQNYPVTPACLTKQENGITVKANILHSIKIDLQYYLFISPLGTIEFAKGDEITVVDGGPLVGKIIDIDDDLELPKFLDRNKSIVHALVSCGWGHEVKDISDIARGDLFHEFSSDGKISRVGMVTQTRLGTARTKDWNYKYGLSKNKQFEYVSWGVKGKIDSRFVKDAKTKAKGVKSHFVRLKNIKEITIN